MQFASYKMCSTEKTHSVIFSLIQDNGLCSESRLIPNQTSWWWSVAFTYHPIPISLRIVYKLAPGDCRCYWIAPSWLAVHEIYAPGELWVTTKTIEWPTNFAGNVFELHFDFRCILRREVGGGVSYWDQMFTNDSFSKPSIATTAPMQFGKWYVDVETWKHFPHYWLFVRGICRSSIDSPHKEPVIGTLIFSFYQTIQALEQTVEV